MNNRINLLLKEIENKQKEIDEITKYNNELLIENKQLFLENQELSKNLQQKSSNYLLVQQKISENSKKIKRIKKDCKVRIKKANLNKGKDANLDLADQNSVLIKFISVLGERLNFDGDLIVELTKITNSPEDLLIKELINEIFERNK